MAQITELDPSITFDSDLGIIDAGNISLANSFGAEEVVEDLSAIGGDTLLTTGEGLQIDSTDADGTLQTRDTTYLGDVTISTSEVTLGVPFISALTIRVNPIEGELVEFGDGTLGVITDQSLTDGRLGVEAELTVMGVPFSFGGSLADLDEWVRSIPGIGPLLDGIADLGQYTLDTAIVTYSFDSGGTMIVCFTIGTPIRTPSGDRPIETLQVGDLVSTRDNGDQPIRWIGQRVLSRGQLGDNPALRPIRIEADALGPGLPRAPLTVSPQHRILVSSKIAMRMYGSDEVLVPAKRLLDQPGVSLVKDADEVIYMHLLCDRHEILFAQDLPAESLYTGKMALKALSPAARHELRQIFPDYHARLQAQTGARPFVDGPKARRFLLRHRMNRRTLAAPGDRRPPDPD